MIAAILIFLLLLAPLLLASIGAAAFLDPEAGDPDERDAWSAWEDDYWL